jgi:hypothetical protein
VRLATERGAIQINQALSGALSVVWVLLLIVPPFAELVEQLMLLFLSTRAR